MRKPSDFCAENTKSQRTWNGFTSQLLMRFTRCGDKRTKKGDGMREKLIELLNKVQYQGNAVHGYGDNYVQNSELADYLLANGVTLSDTNVGKWIPVTESLPEESGAYLVATERGGVFITHYSKRGHHFSISRMGSDVTHWQEKPIPPKGDV